MAWITDIQKYCTHDGKGIRTTVFFKGCPLRCQWCHNPETQRVDRELRFFSQRCLGCGRCVRQCPSSALTLKVGTPVRLDRATCIGCGGCVTVCPSHALTWVGQEKPVDVLLRELLADQMFYEESGGGVTLSGGEVMTIDPAERENLVRTLWEAGVSVNIDTCGFCDYERLQDILPYVDTFLYDLKQMNPERHRKYTGVDPGRILENLRRLAAAGANIWIRIPVIDPVNSENTDIRAIGQWLLDEKIWPEQIHLIPYHGYGTDKYEQLGRPAETARFRTPSEERMAELQRLLIAMGFPTVKIGG